MLRIWSQLNRAWKRLFLFVLAASLTLTLSTFLFWDVINELPDRWHLPYLNSEPVSTLSSPADIFALDPELNAASRRHPIDDLIDQAQKAHQVLLEKQTQGLEDAAQAYRQRRGRHPPPQFDEWVAFAEARGCLMIEEFWDRIYHDLDPFWAIDSRKIRADAAAGSSFIRVRNGIATRSEDDLLFVNAYFDLIQVLAPRLPDLDMFINHLDESRVLVPWHTMAQYMNSTLASRRRSDLTSEPRVTSFHALSKEVDIAEPSDFVIHGPYWNLARQTCPPESQTPLLDQDSEFTTPPTFPEEYPYGTYSGFIQNWTVSQDFCHKPYLRNMHGTFVEPVSISTSPNLLPIFSGSKLLTNNDILLPGAMYWTDRKDFAPPKHPVEWHNKRDEVFWRGTASGGRNKVDNWTRFHRHRFVSLLNGSQVAMTLKENGRSASLPHNFPPPNQDLYPLVATKLGLLADWIRSFSNVAFYWLECFPGTRDYECSYTGSWYRRGRTVPMYRMYLNKYLPDVDGNSFSGRFRAFLMSNSLPIKATIYTEWHDSRLVPWVHFVPMDITFMDTLSVLEYLFQHDDRAERIAREGRQWTERVLRKDDMLVYVYRLLLEYARVSDPKREDMGYRQDLK